MKSITKEILKDLEQNIENSYSLPIFRGYKAINKTGVEKLIDDIYANLPQDVKNAREFLKSHQYELKNNSKSSNIYNLLNTFEIKINSATQFAQYVILNVKDIEDLLNQVQNNLPEEILKAEILSKQ